MDIQKINEQLDEKIPRDCVSTRKGGGSQQLSYLETHYVIDRMNKVFGNLGWSSETVELKQLPDTDKPAYSAKVRIAIHNSVDGRVVCVREGTGYGVDKSTMNAHEMAIKEAESDAFKRAAKNFGQSMGLALYDKTQENVEDTKHVTTTSRPVRTGSGKPVANEPVAPDVVVESTQDASIDEVISSTSRVVIAKKKATLEDLKNVLKEQFNVSSKSELTNSQKELLLNYLKGLL